MNKSTEISTREEIRDLRFKLAASSEQTRNRLRDSLGSKKPLELLKEMKFFKEGGCDPFDKERSLNFIEQLNLTFTYVASLLAVEYLLDRHPEAVPFKLNWGTASGPDIHSDGDGGIVAEVFSCTKPQNAGKLTKDASKVSEAPQKHKYVFFMCPRYEGRQPDIPRYPDVTILALPFDNCLPLGEHRGVKEGLRPS